jgi:DNA-binding CsgD family transcriptional regulator
VSDTVTPQSSLITHALTRVRAEGGVVLVRAPIDGTATDLLRATRPAAYAAAQPSGFGPTWTPWGGIVATLARSLPPDHLDDRVLDPLAALGPRTAMALARAELPGGDVAPEQVALALLALVDLVRTPIVADRLERATERALRALELFATEIPPQAALVLGVADGPVADRLERLVRAVGGVVLDATPADASDAVRSLERRISRLDPGAPGQVAWLLDRLGGDPAAEALACERLSRALRDTGVPPTIYEPIVRRGLRLAAGLGDESLSTRLSLLVARFEPVAGTTVSCAVPLAPDPVLVTSARRLGGLAMRAAAIDPFADLSCAEALALAAEARSASGDPADRCRLFDVAARALLYRHGEHRAAESLFLEAEAEAVRGDLGGLRVVLLLGQATCQLMRGDLDDAAAVGEVAAEILGLFDAADRLAAVLRLALPGSVALFRGGDWPALRRAAARWIAAPGGERSIAPAVIAAYDALFAVYAGDPDAARRRIAAASGAAAALGARGYVAQGVAGLAASAAAALGDPAPLLDELLAAQAAAGVGPYVVVTIPLARARLLAVADPRAGAVALHAAAEDAGRQELRAIEAVARAEAALALLRAGDRDGARSEAAAAAPPLERVGARPLLAAIAGLLDRPPRVRLPDGLSPREAEVLALLTGGATNAEIAAQLVLSPHTVNRHVANAYAKAGLRNRAEAATYALRSGLVASAEV